VEPRIGLPGRTDESETAVHLHCENDAFVH
jgi:hypothetical protein